MKHERFKILFISFSFCFCFLLLSFLLAKIEYNGYKKSVNEYIYGIVSTLKENYPNIKEEEIVSLINGKKSSKYIDIFKKYGINEQDPILYNLEKNYKKNLILSLCYILFLTFVFLFFFFRYILKKENRIKEITNYIKELNQKNYELKIINNEEGTLSILQNEIYKTTIMLREESENLRLEKIALKDSISDISHQLKTPITSILIMLDNIIDNPKMEEKTKIEFIKNVEHQVENLNFLIVSLLKISRLDADAVEFKKETILVETIIKKAIDNISVLNKEKKVNIEIVGDKNISFIGDFRWELEAITNILKNAIEHSHEKGNIKISFLNNPLFTKICIQDNGVGMNKKDLQNIFKRFYKGENSSNDSIGIGLSLTKKIIEKDSGLIKVDSQKDRGTTFEIRYMK